MPKITLADRQRMTHRVIDFMVSKNLETPELIRQTYNNAIRDALDAIDVYSKKNPQHSVAFISLKDELDSWMSLPEIEEKK